MSVNLIQYRGPIGELSFPAGIYLFGVGDGGAGAGCEICSGLAVGVPEGRHWRRSGI